MGSRTETVVLQSHDYGADVEQLQVILDRFQDMEDDKSREIFFWGTKVSRAYLDLRSAPQETMEGAVHEAIDALSRKILVNSLGGSPLRNPVFLGKSGLTTEEWMYHEIRALFPIFPLDGEPLPPVPEVQPLVKAVIDWRDGLSTPKAVVAAQSTPGYLSQPKMAVECSRKDPRIDELRRFAYHQLFQQAVLKKQNRDFRRRMDEQEVATEQLVAELKALTVREVGDREAEAAAHEARLREHIDALKQSHEADVSERNRRLADLHSEIETLERQMSSMEQANSATADSIRTQNAARHEELQRLIHALTQELETRSQENQRTISRLTEQLNEATRAHQAAMASLTETHGRTVSGLQAQEAETRRELTETQNLVRQGRGVVAQQAAEIQSLRNGLAQAQREAAQARADADDGFCAVM